jgi:hypothetical protein
VTKKTGIYLLLFLAYFAFNPVILVGTGARLYGVCGKAVGFAMDANNGRSANLCR